MTPMKINCNNSDQKPKKQTNKTTVKFFLLINVHHRSSKRRHWPFGQSDLCWHKLEAEIFSFLGIIYDLFILLHVMKLNHKQVTRMTFNISTLDIEVACTHFEN